jgi:hypothetical protein
VPAFQDGIDATDSDPFVVADPDLIVPAVEPSWLAQILSLLDRHPDFGLIGTELDMSNLPPGILSDEDIAALKDDKGLVDGELWEGNVGSHFQTIRRGALTEPYYSDFEACEAVRRAGWRVGRVAAYKVHHLGFDDIRDDPDYVARKQGAGDFYPDYNPLLGVLAETPKLEDLALAAPLARELAAAGVPLHSVVELAWDSPPLARCLPEVSATSGRAPLALEGGAGAVVVSKPPADAVDEAIAGACRVAQRLVLVLTALAAVGGRLAGELAPAGWSGREADGPADLALAVARAADRDQDAARGLGHTTVQQRDAWLRAFDAMPRGDQSLRLFVLEREGAQPPAEWPAIDREQLAAPPAIVPAPAESKGLPGRLRRSQA